MKQSSISKTKLKQKSIVSEKNNYDYSKVKVQEIIVGRGSYLLCLIG